MINIRLGIVYSTLYEDERAMLDAARDVVVTQGYAAAQLDVIAARAGLTKGAIYSIFGSKRDLVLALLVDYTDRVLPWIEAALPAGSATCAEILTALGRAYRRAATRPDARAVCSPIARDGGG